MNAQQEAGAIIAHYLRQLTHASGRRWTAQNDHDMQRLAALLADEEAETIAPYYQPAPELLAGSTSSPQAEPAGQIGSAVTQVLEREPAKRQPASADDLDDPNFQRWRQQRQRAQSNTTIAQRMIDRERR
jgi:hypothetical protein